MERMRASAWRSLVVLVIAAGVMGFGRLNVPAVDAARSGDWETVRALIRDGADVNEAAPDGSTVLHWASYWNDVEMVDLLIQAGANVNAATDLGVTPIWAAAEDHSLQVVTSLLKSGADPNVPHISGETAIMRAARAGQTDVVKALLAAGADPNARGQRQQTALMFASAQGHPDAVQALLAGGADVHAKSESWPVLYERGSGGDVHPDQFMWIEEGGYTAIVFAARAGNLDVAQVLVAGGANVNDEAASGLSALILAIHSVPERDWYFPAQSRVGPRAAIGGLLAAVDLRPKNDSENLIDFLLEQGADPNTIDGGYSPLHTALLRRSFRGVRALLDHGADPNLPIKVGTPTRRDSFDFYFDDPFIGASPYWLAARFNQPDMMRLLAERGADPKFTLWVEYWGGGNRELGWPRVVQGTTTALMAAVGMPGGSGFPFRQPPDREASEAVALETVRVAVELGGDVNATNEEGRSALAAARSLRYTSVVDFLLAGGAVDDTPANEAGPSVRGRSP